MEFKLKTLVDHPFSFAIGVGLANGLLAKARDKKIDLKTAATLGSVIGIGETALVMYEPQHERGEIMSQMSLAEVGFWSCAGLFVGLLPFVHWGPVQHGELAKPGLLASATPNVPPGAAPVAVGGYGHRAHRRY